MYVIHHFGATTMKLQGTIFLLPAIKNLSSSLQFKTSLGFSSVYTELSLLPYSWSFHILDVLSKNLQSNMSSWFCIYLPLLFSLQGNLLDHSSVSFQALLYASNLYSKRPWYLKEIIIIILKLHASCWEFKTDNSNNTFCFMKWWHERCSLGDETGWFSERTWYNIYNWVFLRLPVSLLLLHFIWYTTSSNSMCCEVSRKWQSCYSHLEWMDLLTV